MKNRISCGMGQSSKIRSGAHRRNGSAVLLLLSAALLGGCTVRTVPQDEPSDETIVVGFAQVGAESDWRIANSESMRQTFTEENGYELMFDDAKQKQENQIAAIRNYILQEVDYIVLPPIVETGWDEVLKEAKEAGIPVITMDRMAEIEDESLFTAWVGSDTYREGEMAAERLAVCLEERGKTEEPVKILHVLGTVGSTPQLGRTAGLEQGVKEHKNWTIAARVEGEFTQAKAYEEVSSYLKESRDIDVIYCENDNSAFGAIQALEEAGITYGENGDVIIVSFDASHAGLTACMEGKININVECNPLHGPRVERIIQQIEAGETPEKYAYVDETYFEPDMLTEELIAARMY